jgi:hypothetical protein
LRACSSMADNVRITAAYLGRSAKPNALRFDAGALTPQVCSETLGRPDGDGPVVELSGLLLCDLDQSA